MNIKRIIEYFKFPDVLDDFDDFDYSFSKHPFFWIIYAIIFVSKLWIGIIGVIGLVAIICYLIWLLLRYL